MCCRTHVQPIHIPTALAILEIGMFKPTYKAESSDFPTLWERRIDEENSRVTVSLAGQSFEINITPSISAYEQHAGKRITAGVYFEIAAKYAEKVGGEIIQRATVMGCRLENEDSALLLASYPSIPLMYDRICNGFKAVLIPPEF